MTIDLIYDEEDIQMKNYRKVICILCVIGMMFNQLVVHASGDMDIWRTVDLKLPNSREKLIT